MSIRYFFGDEQKTQMRSENCFEAKVVFRVVFLKIER
jgi:hypothetical protein